MNMRLILVTLLFASVPLSSTAEQTIPTEPASATEHVAKASMYGCFAVGSLLMAATTGWAYWFHKEMSEIKTPPFFNEDYKRRQALVEIIFSGATFGYTASKALEHTVKIFATKQTTDALDAKLDRVKHVCKCAYWAGAVVGCHAVVNELENIRTGQHIAPDHFAVHYEDRESANSTYNFRVKALATLSEGVAMAATGYPLFRAIKEAEYAVKVSPSSVSVTLHI